MRNIVLSASLITALWAQGALADTLILQNGDRITGKFVEIDGGTVSFRPENTDQTLSYPLNLVAQLRTDGIIQVLMEDGTEVRGRAVEGDDGEIRLDSEQFTDPVTFPVTAIRRGTGPDTPVREPVRTTGNISLGARITDGNTRSQTYSGTADATVRTDVNRIRFAADFNRSEEGGEETVDNASGSARYDHFVSDRFYLNSNVSLARDRFRDLRLRSSVGVGLGFQFFEFPTRNLSAELGVSYVNEDRYVAENESNPAGRWGIDYEERFAGNGIRLFHSQTGLVNLEDTDDVVINSRTGVRFPFVIGMTGTFQVNVDYENQPPGDNRRIDTAYVLTAGYSW